MARLGLAERDDLVQWGKSQGAPADLPDLVRRLILETTPGVVSLGFPVGVGVYSSGWDGTAKATDAGLNVPAGLSLWELSTRADVNKKADDDYAKRTDTPDGTPTAEASYIAVSTRTWRDRATWANAKRQAGRWRDVQALGVDEVDTWLRHAPVTHAWLSEKLGLQPHGVITTQAWWDRFARATDPALTAKVILAGRDETATEFRQRLAAEGHLITIAGASVDDVLAFVAAVAISATDEDGGALLARAAYLDKVEAFRRWRDLKRPLALTAVSDEVAAEMSGTVHHLIVPVSGSRGDLTLPPIDAQLAAAALQEAGLAERIANDVGQLLRLSLTAGRRRLAVKPELHRPGWARPPIDRLTRRMTLLGKFAETADGDLEIVGEMLGSDYTDVSDEVAALATGPDPLLVRLLATIGVVSPIDAWLLVVGELRNEDLEAFHAAAVKVLTEPDPRFELPADEQWRAGVVGKTRIYSSDLRHGLATALALMGAYGDDTIAGARLTGREWAAWIVRLILQAANRDDTGRLWASLDDVIRLLAEAAPDEFLTAVRTALAGDEPLLAKLFTDAKERSTLFGGNSHSGLLWALETVSWSQDHFGAVVDLLARWAEVDPGGRYANRPAATLVDFFRAWYPQTSVSPERRVSVLDRLRERHPAIAWPLLLALLPEPHSIASRIAEPTFRDWARRAQPTNADVVGFYEAIATFALADADADPSRLKVLIEHLPTLPPATRTALLDRLAAERDQIERKGRNELWTVMRAEAAQSREYQTAVLALSDGDVTRLEQIAERYRPDDVAARTRWLFDDHMPSLPGTQRSDYEQHAHMLAQARSEAASEISQRGWQGVYEFANSIKLPGFFGAALADAAVHEFEPELVALLGRDDAAEVNLAASYFGARFRADGWDAFEPLLADETLSPRQRARLLLETRDYPASWEKLTEPAVAAEYWREFRIYGLGAKFPHVATVMTALFELRRFGAGLDMLVIYMRDDSGGAWADLAATGLEELLTPEGTDEVHQLSQYGLRTLFNYLERIEFDRARLARLEWAYLAAFEFEATPPALARYLAESPAFFADVVSLVFKPGDEDERDDEVEESGAAAADGEEDEPDQQAIEIARNGYRLLSEWRTLPGREGDTVDGGVLRQWVDEARARLREERRLRVGDNFIGKLLAASPPDPDGAWPCHAVRDVLETVDSQQLERGFVTEIFNSLGMTSRGVLDGGDQERDRSAVYRDQAQRFVDGWPKTAALLRDAADSFERLAREHDADAERSRTGF
jgi:hypothetical protein